MTFSWPLPNFGGVKRTDRLSSAAYQQRVNASRAKASATLAKNAKRDAIIRSRHRAGEGVTALARDYGLSRQGIYDILKRADAA